MRPQKCILSRFDRDSRERLETEAVLQWSLMRAAGEPMRKPEGPLETENLETI